MKILSAEFVTSAVGPDQFPTDRKPQIAFAGRSNVGKSSIINTLVHRKNLVKTSSTPGKTQTINFFIINNSFYFTDLPGYGYARVPRVVTETWAPMIEGYLKDTPELRAAVVLLDVRRTPDERDLRLIQWLREYDIPAIYALTKADKLNAQEARRVQREIRMHLGISETPVLTSAKSGMGVDELRAEIFRRVFGVSGQRSVGVTG